MKIGTRETDTINPTIVRQHRDYWHYLDQHRNLLTMIEERKIKSLVRVCPYCGRKFTVYCNYVDSTIWKKIKFCSPMCLELVWKRRNQQYKKTGNYHNGKLMVKAQCEVCGQTHKISWMSLCRNRRVCDACLDTQKEEAKAKKEKKNKVECLTN